MGWFVRPCRELRGIPSGGIVVTRTLLLTLTLATLVGVAGASAQQRQITGQVTGVERRNAAIATSVVAGADITSAPAPALDRALAGRVPGAYIQQNSGAPGGGTQVQIRGSNTVIGSANPLYVVDGVIISDASLSSGLFSVTGSGNPQSTRNDGEKQDDPVNRLADLNPNDVASVEIR